eukprot:8550442-Pyramimonas_sp.AAC.1
MEATIAHVRPLLRQNVLENIYRGPEFAGGSVRNPPYPLSNTPSYPLLDRTPYPLSNALT